jgi:hypothetical protein
MGYIITTSDFQKGAIDTSAFTNIELLTWEEFQLKFFESWFESFFTETITKELDPLMSYTEPILPKWFPLLSPEDKRSYYSLKDKYDALGIIVLVLFSTYSRSMIKRDIPKLPLIDNITDPNKIDGKIPEKILKEKGYREFLEEITKFGQQGIKEFREIKNKYSNQGAYE